MDRVGWRRWMGAIDDHNRLCVCSVVVTVVQQLFVFCCLFLCCCSRDSRSRMLQPPSILDDFIDPDSIDELEDVTGVKCCLSVTGTDRLRHLFSVFSGLLILLLAFSNFDVVYNMVCVHKQLVIWITKA